MARRGSGSSRNQGSRTSNAPRDVQISKAMSWLLRHGAKGEGIKMDKKGYVNVKDLLAWPRVRSLSLTFPELKDIVATNAKQRFSMIPLSSDPPDSAAEDPSQYLIRANQGHSLAITSDNLLKPILATDPNFPRLVVHGTNDDAWKLISKSGGLRKMSRQHVHFATGVPEVLAKGGANSKKSAMSVSQRASAKNGNSMPNDEGNVVVGDQGTREGIPQATNSSDADKVISGMRANASILIWVDVQRSMNEGGLKWWRSDNGVILTEGDAQGFVKMDWMERVESRRTGDVLWLRHEDGK